ncbi:MAG: inositol monophosphatase family protein [Candidatus Sumerlaeia bacterium]|nr:inositol monophosphatase family protein [Candidatus Sumerlaeia bacterium]
MATLNDVLDSVEPAITERIKAALALMRTQAVGAEAYRQNAKVWTKEDNSPVSIADLLHQTQLQELLSTQFPEDGLISEESPEFMEQTFQEASAVSRQFYGHTLGAALNHVQERGSTCTWVFDPIDGTKGYLKGRYYAIALAFFWKDVPLFGAMAIPHQESTLHGFSRSLAFALKGHGTWIASLESPETPLDQLPFHRVDAQKRTTNGELKLGMSLEHGDGLAERFANAGYTQIKIDSQAKYLAVATGDLDAYVRQTRSDRDGDLLWDHLPGMMLVQEAGGFVGSFDGSPIVPLVQSEIRFVGGMVCERGTGPGPMTQLLQTL